jgi:hypothetical protein
MIQVISPSGSLGIVDLTVTNLFGKSSAILADQFTFLTKPPLVSPNITTQPVASGIIFGQTLASSVLSGGVSSVAGTFTFSFLSTEPILGTSMQGYTFTPTDTTDYNTSQGTVSITVSKVTPTPSLVFASPETVSATVGSTEYEIASSSIVNGGAITYTSASPQIASVGFTTGLVTGVSPGTAVITATQAAVAGVNAAATQSYSFTVTAAVIMPIIISSPLSQMTRLGYDAIFSVTASGTSPTYQWNLNGSPITAATSSSYKLLASVANIGKYTCTVTNAAGSATSAAALLVINSTHIANISARAVVGTSNLSVGFVTSGITPKSLLIRGDGPALSTWGVGNFLASPLLTLYNSDGTSLATNSAWGGSTSLYSTFTQVGAFPLVSSSNDTAILKTLNSGSYSAIVSSANGSTGSAVVEIYDADPAGSISRLVNISARGMVGSGSAIMTGGFVISGNSTETVLIRVIGPTLSVYGVANVLLQPSLTLYNSAGSSIASNTVWGGGGALTQAMAQVGAFNLPSGSSDSALLITLPAGAYTVQASGLNGTAGNALVEIYEISSP